MAAQTKALLTADLKTIFKHSGSEGGTITNIANYVYELYETLHSASATTANAAIAMSDTAIKVNGGTLSVTGGSGATVTGELTETWN